MAHFHCQLHSPRPTFPHDITQKEREAMTQQAAYLQAKLADGVVMFAGGVLTGRGSFLMVGVDAADMREVQKFCDDDPMIRAKLGFRYEINPMPFLLWTDPRPQKSQQTNQTKR